MTSCPHQTAVEITQNEQGDVCKATCAGCGAPIIKYRAYLAGGGLGEWDPWQPASPKEPE